MAVTLLMHAPNHPQPDSQPDPPIDGKAVWPLGGSSSKYRRTSERAHSSLHDCRFYWVGRPGLAHTGWLGLALVSLLGLVGLAVEVGFWV